MARYGSYSGKKTVSIIYDPTMDSYKFNFPYHADLIAIIKSTIPSNMRSLDPQDNGAWYVSVAEHTRYADGLIALLHATFPSAQFFEFTKEKYEEQSRFNIGANVPDATKTFQEFSRYAVECGYTLSRETSFSDAQKIYRKLAIKWHPDKDPANTATMTDINSKWATLKEQKFFKETA